MFDRISQLLGLGGDKRVSELIGRSGGNPSWKKLTPAPIDFTTPDYEYFDKLRRGIQKGFELSGPIAARIPAILSSYVAGGGFEISLLDVEDEYTNEILARWSMRVSAAITQMTEELYALGDQFVFVNVPSGELSIPSPDAVTLQYSDTDTRDIVRAEVNIKSGDAHIVYVYEKTRVTVTTKRGSSEQQVEVYPNPLGIVPVVHFANDRAANEVYGRPVVLPLYWTLVEYNDLLQKETTSAKVMGAPIPTFEGMKNPEETRDLLSDEQLYYADDGEQKTRRVIDWDMLSEIFVGEGGSFKFAGPNPSYPDSINSVLRKLFEMITYYTGIPEYAWGIAISSSKASAETQTGPFLRVIENRRLKLQGASSDNKIGSEAGGGLLGLAEIWLRTRQLTDPRIIVDDLKIHWPELTPQNREINLEWVKLLWTAGVLTDETAVRVADLPGVGDPAVETKLAQEASIVRQAKFDRDQEADIADAIEAIDHGE